MSFTIPEKIIEDNIEFRIETPASLFPSKLEMYFALADILSRYLTSTSWNFESKSLSDVFYPAWKIKNFKENREQFRKDYEPDYYNPDIVHSFIKPRYYNPFSVIFMKILMENEELRKYLTNDKVKSIKSFVDRVLPHLEKVFPTGFFIRENLIKLLTDSFKVSTGDYVVRARRINYDNIVSYYVRNIYESNHSSPYGDGNSCFFNTYREHVLPFLGYNDGYIVTIDVYDSSSGERKGGARFLVTKIYAAFDDNYIIPYWVSFNSYSKRIIFSNALWVYVFSKLLGFKDYDDIKEFTVIDNNLIELDFLHRNRIHINGVSLSGTYSPTFSGIVYGELVRPRISRDEDIDYPNRVRFLMKCPLCKTLKSTFARIFNVDIKEKYEYAFTHLYGNDGYGFGYLNEYLDYGDYYGNCDFASLICQDCHSEVSRED